jgi:hypothetical protein
MRLIFVLNLKFRRLKFIWKLFFEIWNFLDNFYPKQLLNILIRFKRKFCNRHLFGFSNFLGDVRHMGWLAAFPSKWHRRHEGAVCLQQ